MDHTELLALILPPQGRLVVAATESAGLLPGPGLVLALEHKTAAGSQTVAALLDRDRAGLLRDALDLWLENTEQEWPTQPATAPADQPALPGLDVATESTVAAWLASDAEETQL